MTTRNLPPAPARPHRDSPWRKACLMLAACALVVSGGLALHSAVFSAVYSSAAVHDAAYMNLDFRVRGNPPNIRLAGTIDAQYGTVPTGSVTAEVAGSVVATATLDAAGGYVLGFAAQQGWGYGEISVSIRYSGDHNHNATVGPVAVTIGSY